MVDKPTGQQLLEAWDGSSEDYMMVHEATRPHRHGYAYTYVFSRISDATFWETGGVCEKGGEYHTLRDGTDTVAIRQVFPKTVQVVTYSGAPA